MGVSYVHYPERKELPMNTQPTETQHHSKLTLGLAALGLTAVMLVGTAGIAGAAESGTTRPTRPAVSADGARRRPGAHVRKVGFEAAAQVLGQDPKALLQAMAQNGQTLAQIAGDKTDEVIAAAVAAIEGEVSAAHEAGKLTDEQYAQLTQRMDAHLQDRVTHVVQNWVPKPRPQS